MGSTRWGDIAAAATAAFDAAVTCPVFDGPPTSGDQLTEYVCIGAQPPDSVEPNAGTIRQEQAYASIASPREEIGEISCYVSCWSGDMDVAAQRTRALAILDDLVAVLDANKTLGLTGNRAPEIELRTGQILQGLAQQGTRVDVTFVLAYVTQIAI